MKRPKPIKLQSWQKFVKQRLKSKKHKVQIAIVGKYFGSGEFQLTDAYYALIEAVKHGALANKVGLDLKYINAEKDEGRLDKLLKEVDGIIVPIGWGSRGVEGKIKAVQFAREKKVPYLGLCYGMQLACVEFARSELGWADAHTEEVNAKTAHAIIHSIPFDPQYQVIKGDGVSMRLGTYECVLTPGSLADEVYRKHGAFKDAKTGVIVERHRHRYEFNNQYKVELEKRGMVFSGMSPDGMFVEMIELPRKAHPFFLATQGHPEYRSYPLQPHPVFVEFIRAAMARRRD